MSITLDVGGVGVARYDTGEAMPPGLSPRPFLHPVRTLGGVHVTEVRPADHAHHYGVSMALPDVDGTSYWGGSTYVRETGSAMLDNHGREVSTHIDHASQGITETLEYLDRHGRLQLTETRRIGAIPSTSGWVLSWRSSITAAAGAGAVSFGSPETNGRDGAFYGGIFWRLPSGAASAFTETAPDVESAHGSRSDWLAVATGSYTLIASNPQRLPWFVRTDGYVGFGPAVAKSARRELAAGESMQLGLDVLVSDRGNTSQAAAADLAAELLSTDLLP